MPPSCRHALTASAFEDKPKRRMSVETIYIIEQVIAAAFIACYAYQLFYIAYMLFRKPVHQEDAKKQHRYGVVICARNEEEVIGQLLESVAAQDYPSELVEVFVVADNCTDSTAAVARRMGARVLERNDPERVGKGYALDYLFKRLLAEETQCEGFLVLDADNVLKGNYLTEMNKVFDQGFRIITSYRNSKNYNTNWISAGYSLWFIRESKYLNEARMGLGTSCAISGTGFMVHIDVIRRNNGWKHHLLTEDIEFTTDSIIHGERVGYAAGAMLFDEQPETFRQSWTQRLRWSKGFYQVLGNYGRDLAKNIFKKGSFACYDMLMTIFPALFLTLFSILCHCIEFVHAVLSPNIAVLLPIAFMSLSATVLKCYGLIYVIGLITTITEWKNINCSTLDKILYTFTFPLFMLTYIPVSVWAILRFRNIGWAPIKHSVCKSVDQLTKMQK